MGWWEDRWEGKKVKVGDEPIDLTHELLRAFADAYVQDLGRKPITQEFLFSLASALQTTGRELLSDLDDRAVTGIRLTTRKVAKRQTYQVGNFFVVPLPGGQFAYGRIIGFDAAGQVIEVYRLRTKAPLSFAQLQQREQPILFQTHVNGLSAFRDRRWTILGHAKLEKNHPMPMFWLGSPFTFWLIKQGARQWVAKTEEVLRLEPCVVWDPETIEARITSDHPDVWPELEEWQCGSFGDAYLKILHEPSQLRKLYMQHANVTNAGLRYLAACTRLQVLDLASRPITDAGPKHLARLTALEELNLSRTHVTDDGLTHLHGLKKLRKLGLSGTRVTDEGVARLKKRLPSLKVAR